MDNLRSILFVAAACLPLAGQNAGAQATAGVQLPSAHMGYLKRAGAGEKRRAALRNLSTVLRTIDQLLKNASDNALADDYIKLLQTYAAEFDCYQKGIVKHEIVGAFVNKVATGKLDPLSSRLTLEAMLRDDTSIFYYSPKLLDTLTKSLGKDPQAPVIQTLIQDTFNDLATKFFSNYLLTADKLKVYPSGIYEIPSDWQYFSNSVASLKINNPGKSDKDIMIKFLETEPNFQEIDRHTRFHTSWYNNQRDLLAKKLIRLHQAIKYMDQQNEKKSRDSIKYRLHPPPVDKAEAQPPAFRFG